MPELWPTVGVVVMMMNHEVISTVRYAENGTLGEQLLVLLSLHLLLPPQLQNLPMRIRVPRRHERRARRRPVLRHKPTGLVPHAARIAQRLRPHRTRPPLRRLLRAAVQAFPPRALRVVRALALLRRRIGRQLRLRRRRVGEMQQAGGPVPRRRA